MRLLLFLVSFFVGVAPTAASPFENRQIEAVVESLFVPGRSLSDIKLTVDQLVGGSGGRAELEKLADRLAVMAAGAETSDLKLKILKKFIFEPGTWNGGRPFHYDHADPLGTNPANRHLSRYVESRAGNCITMPMLLVFLGRHIGLNMTFAVAPLHVLVKYTDDSGSVWNLEATSGGGFTRDAWYRKELPMSDEAVIKGTYLRPFNEAENTALIASFLVEHLMAAARYEDAIVAADVILRHYPGFAYVHLKRGSAFYLLLKRDVLDHYRTEADLPAEIKAVGDALYTENLAAFAKAESLGWRETDGQKR